MPIMERVAILLDGEFVKKTLKGKLKRPPVRGDVMTEVDRIMAHKSLAGYSLYRVLYYTAEPLVGVIRHPLTGVATDFGATPAYSESRQLIDTIEQAPDVAVRRGVLLHQGWELRPDAIHALIKGRKHAVEPADLVPKIQQKGVDMRIGLDISSLALKRLVSAVVLVTGDSDFVPAMKLARREGLRVFLDTLGSGSVRPELRIEADRVL